MVSRRSAPFKGAMTRWPFILIKLLSVAAVIIIAPAYLVRGVAAAGNNSKNKTTLTVGYLTAIKGELKDKQGLAISGALTMALDEVSYIEIYNM